MKKINIEYFLPDDVETFHKTEVKDFRLSIGMAIIVAISSFLYFFYSMKAGLIHLQYALPFSLLNALFSLYLIKKKGRRVTAGNFLLLGTLAVFLFTYIGGNGGASAGIVWFVLFPVLAVSATTPRIGTYWTVISSILAITISIYMYSKSIDLGFYSEKKKFSAAMMNLFFTPFIVLSLVRYFHITRDYAIKEIDKKREELEHLNQDNRKLLSILVHDVANPLMVIKAKTKLRKSSEYDVEKLKGIIEKVGAAASVLEEVTNQVREIRAMSDGKKSYDLKPVSIKFLSERVHFIFGDRFHEKEITFTVDFDQVERAEVYAETSALSNNVIHNLISNAIKFSEVGGNIRLKFSKISEWICISVKDDGAGINKDKLKDLFNPLAETTTDGTSGEKGSGFGLPIVHQTVEMFGGKVEVASEQEGSNRGTEFKIFLRPVA